ncbi:hypothetical protein C8J57DRAFT_1720825 [Mycena rebaudengoi]|nr:hypothetical protein C8J57DRAFT_1720825 [Mycena rebaudengoi]
MNPTSDHDSAHSKGLKATATAPAEVTLPPFVRIVNYKNQYLKRWAEWKLGWDSDSFGEDRVFEVIAKGQAFEFRNGDRYIGLVPYNHHMIDLIYPHEDVHSWILTPAAEPNTFYVKVVGGTEFISGMSDGNGLVSTSDEGPSIAIHFEEAPVSKAA